jgi:hypothetical protein
VKEYHRLDYGTLKGFFIEISLDFFAEYFENGIQGGFSSLIIINIRAAGVSVLE